MTSEREAGLPAVEMLRPPALHSASVTWDRVAAGAASPTGKLTTTGQSLLTV
jgi:hypothetical protein